MTTDRTMKATSPVRAARWQFSLRKLFGLVTVCAVLVAICPKSMPEENVVMAGICITPVAAQLAAAAWAIANRRSPTAAAKVDLARQGWSLTLSLVVGAIPLTFLTVLAMDFRIHDSILRVSERWLPESLSLQLAIVPLTLVALARGPAPTTSGPHFVLGMVNLASALAGGAIMCFMMMVLACASC